MLLRLLCRYHRPIVGWLHRGVPENIGTSTTLDRFTLWLLLETPYWPPIRCIAGYNGDCAPPYVRNFQTWYGIFHCDSMKYNLMLHWITVEYAASRMKIETLRFLCLNERNISLVAICAVILSCKDFATERHLAPALMHFGTTSWSKMVVSWRYANLSTELSRKFCVVTAKATYTTWLLMT